MKLIVGLGNPDKCYAQTFHNVGFIAIDKLADKLGVAINKKMCEGIVGESRINGDKVFLLKPLTYMNLSGIAVDKIMRKFKIVPQDVYVFVDDIDLPLGKIRYRENGSAGTHNGLKSIVNELGSQDFKRIKIGIGRDEKFKDLADFVLSKIPDEKMEIINKEIDEGIEKVMSVLMRGL